MCDYVLSRSASCENDLDLKFCGLWQHGKGSLSLNVNLSKGCSGISVSANQSALSIEGQITAQCKQANEIQLGLNLKEETPFCLYWDPLLDHLMLQVNQKRRRLAADLLRNFHAVESNPGFYLCCTGGRKEPHSVLPCQPKGFLLLHRSVWRSQRRPSPLRHQEWNRQNWFHLL